MNLGPHSERVDLLIERQSLWLGPKNAQDIVRIQVEVVSQ